MDATLTIQAPSGPMTRARARAIQSEVTSLLLEFPSSSSETWLLPKSEMLCVTYNAQDTEPRAVEEEIGVNTLGSSEPPARARNFRPPDLPTADEFDQPRRANSRVCPDPVPDLPAPGTSGLPGPSGPRMPAHLYRTNSLVRPDPPRNLRRPEHLASPGTSGPACEQRLGPRPVYPFVT